MLKSEGNTVSLLRPWPSGNILEAGRATPASLASADLEPLVSPPAAPLVSPELGTSQSSLPAPAPAAPPSGRPGHGHEPGGTPTHQPNLGRGRFRRGRPPPGGLTSTRHHSSDGQLTSDSPPRARQRRSPSPAVSEASSAGGRAERSLAGPPPSYSQTLLDVQPPSYEAACEEYEKRPSDGEGG